LYQWPLAGGLMTVDVKGGVTMGSKAHGATVTGCVELSQKVFNFQEDQAGADTRSHFSSA